MHNFAGEQLQVLRLLTDVGVFQRSAEEIRGGCPGQPSSGSISPGGGSCAAGRSAGRALWLPVACKASAPMTCRQAITEDPAWLRATGQTADEARARAYVPKGYEDLIEH